MLSTMKSLKFSLSIVSIVSFAIGGSLPTHSRPHPDRSGVCYFFRAEQHELTQTCVISSGYGAGGHYAVLQWPDGVKTAITKINLCPRQNHDQKGFCKYTVDNYEAKPYQRNVFLKPTATADTENLDCYRVISTGNSVCYRSN